MSMNDESRFDNEENDYLIELTDEDGVTTTFEILAQFPFKGENFVAVSAPEQDENDEDLEVLLLQVAEDENGEEILVTPDSNNLMMVLIDDVISVLHGTGIASGRI